MIGHVVTAGEMSPHVGMRAELVTSEGWSVSVTVRDLRACWGKVHVLVSDGRREAWVESTRLVLRPGSALAVRS